MAGGDAFHVSPFTYHFSPITSDVDLPICVHLRFVCCSRLFAACRAEGFAKEVAFVVFFAFFVLFCGYFGFPPA
jgi:hypothetical protein